MNKTLTEFFQSFTKPMFWFAVSIITMAFILLKILLPNIIDFGVIGTVLVAAGVVLLIIQIINENKKEKKDERRT